MKKIPFQFPEKHLCYCANHMKSVVASDYFGLLNQVSSAIKSGTYQPDDLVAVQVHPDEVLKLMQQLGERKEQKTSGLHLLMKKSLKDQLTALVTSEMAKPEEERDVELLQSIQYLGEQIGVVDAGIDAWQQNEISSGRTFLMA